ncbi:MAG: DUF2730 family protein [Sphingomonadales bacterium]|nr:DUF2730 family protein [Sphingomonadales bacterium]
MSIASLNQWFSLFALTIGIANALWLWISRPARDTNKRIDETNEQVEALIKEQNDRCDRHRENLKEHDRRLQRVEDDMRHLPTKDDLSALSHKITGMSKELDIVCRTTTRIDDFLRADR